MDKENVKVPLDVSQKFYDKLDKVVSNIEKINQKKSGYNFEYVPIEFIIKAIQPVAKEKGLFIDTAPQWVFDINNMSSVPVPVKEGKEFFISGIVKYDIIDLNTGYVKHYYKLAAGKAADPGQAVGSAESYSLRQWMNKTFSVEVEREEFDVSEKVMVLDKNKDAVNAVTHKEVGKLLELIVTKTGKPETIKTDVAMLLKSYNEHNKTNYDKIRDSFPETELEDLMKYAAALFNVKG